MAVLLLLQLAAYPQAMLVIDSGRDIANAWAIASGGPFPAVGPGIYGTWALGPVWFYFLALPLALGGSLTLLSLWVGLLAVAKIPLAYLLVRHWSGPAAALAMAALVALPGWNSISAMIIAHTSVTEAAVLGSLLASSRAFSRPTTPQLLLAAAVFSLALHAHPTAVIAAPWLCAALWRHWQQHGSMCSMLGALAVFLLPWLPMLVAEAKAGWPQLAATRGFAMGGAFLARAAAAGAVAWGLLAGWPPLLARYLVPAPPGIEMLLALVWHAALAAAATGVLMAIRMRPMLTVALLANLAAALLMVVMLRPTVPVYMCFALFPLAAWTAVHGWSTVLPHRALHAVAWSILVAAAVLQAGVLHQRLAVVERGSLPFPGAAVDDVRAPVRDDSWIRFWLPVAGHDALAAALCGSSRAVHGELASAYAWASGVALLRTCGVRAPALGGRNADTHVAGTPMAHADLLGLAGDDGGHGFMLSVPAAVLHPASGTPADADPRYAVERYRRLQSSTGVRTLDVRAPCPPGHVLAVNNLMPGLNVLRTHVRSARTVLEPALSTGAASYYRCDGGAVRVGAETLDGQAVDIFLLRTSSSAAASAAMP